MNCWCASISFRLAYALIRSSHSWGLSVAIPETPPLGSRRSEPLVNKPPASRTSALGLRVVSLGPVNEY